jgi:hypothetical protein
MLAGHALGGILASIPPDKSFEIGTIAVLSLKLADTVLLLNEQSELPKLMSEEEAQAPENNIIINPQIILPRE